MMIEHLLALTIAFVLDRIVGDPPSWPHPVKWIGTLIARLEKKLNKGRNRKWKGVVMLFIVLLIVFVPAMLISTVAYGIHPILGIMVESILIMTTIAHKSLQDAALEVYNPLQTEDLHEARLKLSYIVGRDTDQLDEAVKLFAVQLKLSLRIRAMG